MDKKEKRKVWDKTYREKHREELLAKKKANYHNRVRAEQDAVLVALITDYVEGRTIKELQDKYKVAVRNG